MGTNAYIRAAGLTLVVGGILYALFVRERNRIEKKISTVENTAVGMPRLGGPFSLVDQRGNRVTEKDFEGKWMMIYFGFTHCPDICPTELTKMADALKELEASPDYETNSLVPIFISLDPKRDTPQIAGKYVVDFHPKMVGLTGTPEEIGVAAKAYRVYFVESRFDSLKDTDDYLVDHSIFIYLMGPDGTLVDYFGPNRDKSQIVQSALKDMRKRKAAPQAPPAAAPVASSSASESSSAVTSDGRKPTLITGT